MRITIVDWQMQMVREVLDSFDIAEQLPNFADFLATYTHPDYVWFVTPNGVMPEHFPHDAHGQKIS